MSSNKSKAGFGLLEVLLAGVIIITILSALIVVARNSIDNSLLLQQRSQATFLAQEGIEMVRQIRDTNYIDGDASTKWNTLVGPSSSQIYDITKIYALVYDNNVKRYRLETAAANNVVEVAGTRFTRIVFFRKQYGTLRNPSLTLNGVNVAEPPAVVAKVKVQWKAKNANKTIEINELIADSRQGF